MRRWFDVKRWKTWLTAAFLSVSLGTAPVGMVCAASAVETLLYGTAAIALVKKQLTNMDNTKQKQMLADTKAKTGVVENEAYNERLEMIQRNIVNTGMIKRNYDVYANPSKELNAFETIGGVISVNQGMLDALSDDELAFTLCHEMQHGENRHAVNGILKGIGIATLVDIAMGGNAELMDVLLGGVAVNYIDNEVVTMDQEKEADAEGFAVLKNTSYNIGGAPASMQFVYETYGELYQEGFKRIVSPNNHPQMSSRIQKLSERMTLWSGNHVQVGGDMVYVNGLAVVAPAASGSYSTRRRAFLVAGNLARVTHAVYGEAQKKDTVLKEPAEAMPEKKPLTGHDGTIPDLSRPADADLWQVRSDGTDISVNGLRIMTCAAGDDGEAIIKNMQTALYSKPVMVSEKQIKKLNTEWIQKHGYKEKKKDQSETKKTV